MQVHATSNHGLVHTGASQMARSVRAGIGAASLVFAASFILPVAEVPGVTGHGSQALLGYEVLVAAISITGDALTSAPSIILVAPVAALANVVVVAFIVSALRSRAPRWLVPCGAVGLVVAWLPLTVGIGFLFGYYVWAASASLIAVLGAISALNAA